MSGRVGGGGVSQRHTIVGTKATVLPAFLCALDHAVISSLVFIMVMPMAFLQSSSDSTLA